MSDDVKYLVDQCRGSSGSLDFGMLLVLLLFGGRNGLLGGQGVDCAQNMNLINAINDVSAKLVQVGCEVSQANRIAISELGADLTNQINNSNTANARGFDLMLSSNNLQTAAIATGFDKQTANFGNLDRYLCNAFNDVNSAINCSTNTINTNMSNGFQSLQAGQVQIAGGIKDMNCNMNTQFANTNCKIEKLEDKVVAGFADMKQYIAIVVSEIDKKNLQKELENERAARANLEAQVRHNELLLSLREKGNNGKPS